MSAGGDEMPGHATRRQVIAGVLVPRGVRAGTDVGRTRAGRRRQWPSPHCLHPKSGGPPFGLREKWRRSGFDLADRFGVEDMLYAPKDTGFAASLLYYFGILTLGGVTPFGELTGARSCQPDHDRASGQASVPGAGYPDRV